MGPSLSEEEEEEEDMAGRWRETERGVEVGTWSLFLWWFEGRGGRKQKQLSVPVPVGIPKRERRE